MLKQFDKTSAHTPQIIFVAKAREKKDFSKCNLLHVYSDGARIMATDGARGHVYAPADCPLPAGFYRVLRGSKTTIDLVKVEESTPFPDLDRVIPKKDKSTTFSPGTNADVDPAAKLAQVLRAQGSGCFNIEYFLDACPGMSAYSWENAFTPLMLTGPDLVAVIMPMR
jgi:hypothetical protein